MIKPKVIAYSKDLVIIPFDNVAAVDGDYSTNAEGEIVSAVIGIAIKGLKGEAPHISLDGDDADDFINGYNKWLRAIEMDLHVDKKIEGQ